MDFDGQRLQPIRNQVEVLNGQSFRDAVLSARIQPMLAATTVDELLAAVGSAKLSLETLGTNPTFTIKRGEPSAADGVLGVRTVVDLTQCRPAHALSLYTRASNDLYQISGRWALANKLGLGDLLEFSAKTQPEPHTLAAGRAALTTPMPLGRGLVTVSGFFFNENCTWASHSLATHGVAAELRVPWLANVQFMTGVRAVARNIHSISDRAGDVVRAAAGISSLKVSALAELRHSGKFHAAQASLEAAGVPGDTRHIKAQAGIDADLPLTPGRELVLSFSGNAGFIGSSDDKPKICDQFLLGGPSNLLGFERNKVRAQGATDDDYIGGQAFYTSRIALLSKLPFKALSPLRLKTQVDAGVLKQRSGNDIVKCASDMIGSSAALSTASGLTYRSPYANFDVLYVMPVRGHGEFARSAIHVGAELNLD